MLEVADSYIVESQPDGRAVLIVGGQVAIRFDTKEQAEAARTECIADTIEQRRIDKERGLIL